MMARLCRVKVSLPASDLPIRIIEQSSKATWLHDFRLNPAASAGFSAP
jgi:hypothetical protein